MIQIPKDELLASIEQGYKDFEATSDSKEKTRLKGWCNALEAVLLNYAPEMRDEMISLRKRIIKPKRDLPDEIDLDTPTILRTGKAKLVITNNQ
mgnify:CR=1 FL=1